MKSNLTLATLLAAASISTPDFAAGGGNHDLLPKRPVSRTRSKGKAGAPGSKLARKAAKGKIGIR